MKKIIFFLIILPTLTFGQKVTPVYLTFNKTVHMFFPDSISYYDAGSDDVLIDQKGAILKLAPKSSDIDETNLTVITLGNICYSFLLRYSKDISELTYFVKDSLGRRISYHKRIISREDSIKTVLPFKTGEGEYNSICREVIKRAPAYWIGSTVKKVYLAMNNIYVYNDRLYFCLSVGNASNINYDVNYFKFYTVDKKKLKKASRQELEKMQIYTFNGIQTITAQTKDYPLIFVFDKFTIDSDKKLIIELGEKNGERNISIDIAQDLISKAEAYK